MRDKRFIAVHRGGPLTMARHRLLATWAADCAEHVLALFEAESDDARPRRAIEVGRAWARGEVATGVAMKAAVAAHAAARSAKNKPAIAAARAAGHAVATAHFAEHSLGPVVYGLKAVEAAGGTTAAEYAWQIRRLPEALKALVVSALKAPRFASQITGRTAAKGGSPPSRRSAAKASPARRSPGRRGSGRASNT